MSSVLIVDDSPSDRALFRTILTRAGFTVYEVARGRDTIAKAKEVRPHAIILDVNLPDSDGHAVCREIRADREVAGIPVLMLTVRGHDADELAGLEAGADDYVAKDSDSAIILARIRRLIQFRQMRTVTILNEHLVQIGRLLAGIIHEIRAPLTVIRGSAELLRMQCADYHPALQWVEPILRGTQMLQQRLEHLMATVRNGPAQFESIDLAPLVRETANLFLKGSDPSDRRLIIETVFEEPLPRVRADSGRLIQVLLSLLGNAHEALAGSKTEGRLTIRSHACREHDQNWVRVDVTDNGPGIPEAFLDRIFEPYFTTKESGSGYGLYLASEILKELGGRLTACNAPAGGACLSIWLPSAVADEAVEVVTAGGDVQGPH